MDSQIARTESWTENFYDNLAGEFVLSGKSQAELDRSCDFICDALHLRAGELVFDQGCGAGDVSLALAARGLGVIGVDLAANYIERACQEAKHRDADVAFICDDATRYVTPLPCHAAISWYTSFGHAPTHDQNLSMIKRVSDSLESGGRFILDYVNFPGVMNRFQPVMSEIKQTSCGEIEVTRRSSFELAAGWLKQCWEFRLEGKVLDIRETRVRIYLPHMIEEMLHECGFGQVSFFGDLDFSELTLDSRRLICVAQKR